MSVLLLVRHGQASFGAKDYDVLSERGHEQGRVLGKALAERGIRPSAVVHGVMRRHTETTDELVAAAGWDVTPTADEGWAEFDHQAVIVAHKPAYRRATVMKADLARTLKPHKAFQSMFLMATQRWSGGEHDADYAETFTAFAARVQAAAERAATGEGTTVVVTSGGVIALLASQLLTGSAASWSSINAITINTGVTKLIGGSRGLTLVSFNDHSHLDSDTSLITYW